MLVMSTRERSPLPGAVYGGDRAEKQSLYHLVVSIPPDKARKIGEIQWPRGPRGDARTDFVTVEASDMNPADVDRWFLRVAGKKRKLLIFVHGYNNTFATSAYRLAQITHDSRAEAAPVLFTWPSRGHVLDYVYDKESATYSRDALEYLLTRAAANPNVSDITVMAHSMGNWTMVEALRQLSIRRGRLPSKIKNIIMASPDLDVEVFRSQLVQMAEPRPRITIFLSQDDQALALSRHLGGDIDRVGAIDPEREPYRSKLKEFNIVVINLTKLKGGDSFHHSKFAESPEIIRLVGKRLIEGQEIDGRDLTLGERISGATAGAGASIGRSVGHMVAGRPASAPR
ncbi:alpha/beta hydrolase [Sinorhizobium chiapasense]|uniref:Alpha/beta hydrolase n=1 Tax=Sinorhizobium chiapasense TaxID=501572 RepID=A0ABZ2BBP0_9HYPH